MPAEVAIETRIGATIKQKAEAILATEGLTIADLIQGMLHRTVESQTIPYGLFGPNAETREATDELGNGGGKSFATVAELMADLKADA